jgi:Asp-tRNA(Asn)/Glu-tRNA(Gln) amidotransferase A subunit family amidase
MTQSRINFLTATIKDLQELLRSGEVTSVQLVQAYLVFIEDV